MSSHHPTFGTSGLGNMFKSLSKLKNPNIPVKINPTVVGGSTDQDKLFQQLRQGPLPLRASAAARMTESIETYSISSIPEIWYLAKDMCHPKVQSYIRRIAVKLLILCIKHDEMSSSNRLTYFKDIVTFCQVELRLDGEFDVFLKALRTLTADGRDIHDFCIYEGTNLVLFLSAALSLLGRNVDDDTFPTLEKLVNYLHNCFKFSFSSLDEDATVLVSGIIRIASTTQSPKLLTSCLHLLHALVISGGLLSFTPIVHLCCHCYGLVDDEDAKVAAWDIVATLSMGGTLNLLVATLCAAVSNVDLKGLEQALRTSSRTDGPPKFDPLRLCVGAVQLVELVHTHCAEFCYFFTSVLQAYKSLLSYKVPLANTVMLRLFDRLFVHENFDALFPFQVWYASGLYDVLRSFSLNSDQDISYWQSICLSLQTKSIPRDKLVLLLLHHNHPLPETVRFVLLYYRDERLCSLGIFARDNCTKLLNAFFFADLALDVRIETLGLVRESYALSKVLLLSLSMDAVLLDIFKRSLSERDVDVIEYLMQTFFTEVSLGASLVLFKDLVAVHTPLFSQKNPSKSLGIMSFSTGSINSGRTAAEDPLRLAVVAFARAMVTVFVSTSDSEKAAIAYAVLINLCHYGLAVSSVDLALVCLRCFVRMRATADAAVYFTLPTDMDALSTTFGRNGAAQDRKWYYPESFAYLAEDKFNRPKVPLDTIDVTLWLTVVLDILENYYDWELFSFVWAHFCSQLSNMALFVNHKDQVLQLRKVICDQIQQNTPPKLILPPTVTKTDLQIASVRTLSSLMGYHDFFSKHDEDHIISSLMYGLGPHESLAIPCIHILTVCCYEIPLSIKKFLSAILVKLQTSTKANCHTLEFLLALIHLPTLTSNFSIDEFKRVFAIAFKYIQYCHDKISSKEEDPLLKTILVLSFEVIATWFLRIDMNERRHVSAYVVKNLVLNSRENKLDDDVVAVLDLIIRFTYSNIPVKNTNPQPPKSRHLTSNKWIIGHSIVGIDTDVLTGDSMVTVRRPSGVAVFKVALDPQMVPRWADLRADAKNFRAIVNSNYLLLQLFSSGHKPLPIVEDVSVTRAISTFDRIPTVDFHKIGIVYIAPGQSKELEVLGNKVGSHAYQRFLEGLGRFIKLKNCRDAYVGGLDTENDLDGEHAIFWNDQVSQIIFHVTTLMPNNDNDKYFDLKKRHIGNNHVNIFFDESGLPFNFGMVRSQFNFMNIVISPNSLPGQVPGDSSATKFYKVKTFKRSEVPSLFSTCHFKLISENNLSPFIRILAFISDEFANTWHSTSVGSFVSNWSHRVRHINMLREKTVKNHEILKQEQQQHQQQQQQQQQQQNAGEISKANDATMSFLQQLQYDSTAVGITEPELGIRYEYLTEDDNEMYQQVEFNSYT